MQNGDARPNPAPADMRPVYEALDRVQAIVEFELDGTVITANQKFLDIFGYELDEVVGRHHRMFCDPGHVESPDYAESWRKLAAGEASAGQYRRLGKAGREIWLQASYNPVLDPDGKPLRVVKFATDVTDARLQAAEYEGKVAAIDLVQAVVEFELDGTIITANAIFLRAMGYELEEIVGKHHRMFCEPDYAASADYAEFWRRLGAGENCSAEFKRRGKGGREVWLQASYNPILDPDGKPLKVVKFATDVTDAKQVAAEHAGKMTAINRVLAVVEFELDGTIITANQNFLDLFGYSLDEIAGRHHRMFCDPLYAESLDYAEFWQRMGLGEYESGEFERVGRDGAQIWLQASYNPIFDAEGRVIKVVKFASDITEEVYQRSRALSEMSTPATTIWSGVLFLPIVGIIDSRRSLDIMEKALSKIVDSRAHTLMLDIGGVNVVDTAVANHLIRVAKAAVLMGCRTIISGISPAIAQTITDLGIDLGSIRTMTTIEAALKEAITQDRATTRRGPGA